jgi:glycosyltransferase involved in cell wall biosynthesis
MEKRGSGADSLSCASAGDAGSSGHGTGTLPLSVVLCTYNRSTFLQMALASLADQTLDRDSFEVVVIDDGSSDTTREVADSFAGRLPLRYFYQKNAGLAAGKNHGIYAAKGRILFFFDDDDIATPRLLEEHLRSHQQHADESYAVLNYTTWSPRLKVSPLMRFITDVGCFLFSYPNIRHGSVLDYTYFWGGRSSCKRSFLIEHGIFNPIFRFGCEDIELGYRLSHHGLKVVYNAAAVTYMVREVNLDDFYRRLLRQGRSQYHFSSMYDDHRVAEWCETIGAEEKWRVMAPVYDAMVKSTQNLERIVHEKLLHGLEFDSLTRKLLYQAYWWTFRATKIMGIMEARRDHLGSNAIDGHESSAP